MKIEQEDEDLFLILACQGPVLATAEIACDLASIVLRRYEGEEGLTRQQPLYAIDQEENWLVRGSSKDIFGSIGTDSWYMIVKKSNCKVLKIARVLPREFLTSNNQT